MPITLNEITQYLENHSVTNYATLPAANTVTNQLWYCINEQGSRWLFNYKSAGWYFSDGVNWTHQESVFEASLLEVDAGILTDKFVSPNTLANSTWAFTVAKVLTTVLNGLSLASGGVIASSDTILQAFGKLQYQITNLSNTYLVRANNLSDLSSAQSARTNLGLETAANGGNAAYNIGTEKLAYTGTPFTAARTWTLPDSSSLNAWDEKVVADLLQTVTSTNTLTIAVQSGKKLNGVTNGTEVMQSAGGWRRFAPDGSGGWTFDVGIVRQTKTQTLTNKRITSRVTSITSSATPTINTDNCDVVDITALAAAITSMTTNLSGTPTNFQKLIIRIKDNGTARAITWGASFSSKGGTLPTTTVISKLTTVGLIYNTTSALWECVAVAQET